MKRSIKAKQKKEKKQGSNKHMSKPKPATQTLKSESSYHACNWTVLNQSACCLFCHTNKC